MNAMVKILMGLSRAKKSTLMISTDLAMVASSLLIGIFLRDDFQTLTNFINEFLLFFVIVLIISLPIFISFGLYKSHVRYMGFNAMLNIINACSLLAIAAFFMFYLVDLAYLPKINFVLIKYIIIFWLVLNLLIISSRQIARWIINSNSSKEIKREFIIYGAGSAGRSAVSALITNQEVRILGYIDDNKEIHGMFINNYPVLGGLDYINSIKTENNNISVLLAAPSMKSERRREALRCFEENAISVRSLPPLNEIVVGMTNVEQIENLRPEELLDRDAILLDEEKVKKNVEHKSILITGAGGSIGSELSRQIFKLKPKRLILLDHSELNLFNIHNELNKYLSQGNLDIEIIPKLGSILDKQFLKKMFVDFKIDSVYHAAAYKHVSLVEQNIIQGIKNNVIGTYNIVTLSADNNIKSLIHVSTDKAVRPTNFMGASKRIAELIIQGMVDHSDKDLRYTMVRFGNVLGSSGSVIPLFKKQIEDGGPVTVTHKDVTRFFMTVSEASQLVIEAGTQAKGGEVFVLDMGEPVKINDLAKRMIRLSGFSLSKNNDNQYGISIKYTGLRSGEKLYEELILGKDLHKTNNSKVFKANEEYLKWAEIQEMIDKIINATSNGDSEEIKSLMLEYVTDYVPSTDYK
tara:strand:+ start:4239 stop:6143 length:1905 start_codon:yes stop_codon:yes gene_type:complete